jgi:hypothetical protein
VPLSDAVARAVAVHEVYGHVKPQVLARERGHGLFRVASAAGRDTEEGRALAIERRFGVFSGERAQRLALRHLAAVIVVEGGDFADAMRGLCEHGASPQQAVEIAARVCRGGGLAREIIYLPAMHHVEQELRADPELDAWLGSGPLSVRAARVLRQLNQVDTARPLVRAS